MASYFEDVKEFHKMFHEAGGSPRVPDTETWARRIRLILEELSETATAYAIGDLVEYADGLADLTWVVLGTAVESGLPFDEIWEEIKKSNMAKRGAGVDSNGKLMKPVGWVPPNLKPILEKAMLE